MQSLTDYFTDYWHWSNFVVIIVYLFLTTYIGKIFSKRQQTIRDFFLGGRKLPWMAVCGSIIATEISAVTFIIVPMIIFVEGGNFTYLMLAFGKDVSLNKLNRLRASFFESLGAIMFLSIALLGFLGGYFFLNFISKGQPFNLFSAGIIPICNIAICLKVGAGLFLIFVTLVILQSADEEK